MDENVMSVGNRLRMDKELRMKNFAKTLISERSEAVNIIAGNDASGNQPGNRRLHSAEMERHHSFLNNTQILEDLETSFLDYCDDMQDELKSFLLDRPPPLHGFDGEGAPTAPAHEECAFMSCVLTNGKQYYLNMRRGGGEASSGAKGQLLSKSMDELLLEVKKIEEARAVSSIMKQQRQNVDESITYNFISGDADEHVDNEFTRDDVDLLDMYNSADGKAGSAQDMESLGAAKGAQRRANSLWVDKYHPNAFSQLLSPEKINRGVLKSLKGWDRFVFKREATASSQEEARRAGFSTSGNREPSSAEKDIDMDALEREGAGADSDDFEEALIGGSKLKSSGPSDPRPLLKVILLCGPPGTGKTTLAHCVARHCGYRPFEVNASDDRSAAVIKDTIARAMNSNTINVGSPLDGKKPNCIILDEIDGIDSRQSIDAIINIIKAPLKTSADKAGKKGKKGAESSSSALVRPLICICNDQYTPVLRELRKLCQIFVFTPPPDARLVQRLKTVCIKEGLQASTVALTNLCSATGNDIRSSINTLQFASLRTQDKLNEIRAAAGPSQHPISSTHIINEMLERMINRGLKDENKDAFQIWREIFCLKDIASVIQQKSNKIATCSGVKGAESLVASSGAAGRALASVHPSMHVMQSCLDHGDMQLLVSGIYENLHKVNYSDPSLNRSYLATHAFSECDVLESFTRTCPDGFQVVSYVPTVAGVVQSICAVDGKVAVSWPKKDREEFFARQTRLNIISSLRECALNCSVLSSSGVVSLDTASHLLTIIAPKNVRPISYVALSTAEQLIVNNIVRVMASCGLTYSSSKVTTDSNGGYGHAYYGSREQLQLEPPLHELSSYTSIDAAVDSTQAASKGPSALPNELKAMLNAELRKYLLSSAIAAKEDTAPSRDSPSVKPSRAGNHLMSPIRLREARRHNALEAEATTSPEPKRRRSNSVTSSDGKSPGSGSKGPPSSAMKSVLNKKLNANTNDRDYTLPIDTIAELAANDNKRKINFAKIDFFSANKKNKALERKEKDILEKKKDTFIDLSNSNNNSVAGSYRSKQKVFYKFSNGFSNAVRRYVCIKDFIM